MVTHSEIVFRDQQIKRWMKILGKLLGVAGLGLVWYATSWVAFLGLFLALWGNNMVQGLGRGDNLQ